MKITKTILMLAITCVLSLSILAGCSKTPEVTETAVPPEGNYSASDDVSVDTAREATGAEAAKAAEADESESKNGSNQ
ncbi:MAG: hypothetical protein LBN12_00040 [Clostridiales Family XIII bacterium]|jgi:uncharacterized lipoprotein YajG|nr:hypothetical protein [Clostridiales Family XIII bacterium]